MNKHTEIRPYQTPLAWVHLRWLEEYRLSYLVDLYRQNTLKDYLDEQVEKAEDLIEKMLKTGRTREMAEESGIGNLLAPLREDDSP